MTEGEGLLPCPFCGEQPVLLETVETHPDRYTRWYNVRCETCGIEPGAEYESEVIAAWNTRTSTATPSDEGWQPIETFDYEAERRRQGTMFVWATVTDGTQVVPATHWGVDGLDAGWHDEMHQDYDGPEKLDFAPTHWMPLPEPPSAIEGEKK